MQNIKSRFLKINIKRDTPKQMVECTIGCGFHDLQYFEVEVIPLSFFIFLELIIDLRMTSQNFEKDHQFNVIVSNFKRNLRFLLVQCHLLAHHLHRLLKHVDFYWIFLYHHKLLCFVEQFDLILMSVIFSFTKFKISA